MKKGYEVQRQKKFWIFANEVFLYIGMYVTIILHTHRRDYYYVIKREFGLFGNLLREGLLLPFLGWLYIDESKSGFLDIGSQCDNCDYFALYSASLLF